jgi:uroporphyrinogen decarboxylase
MGPLDHGSERELMTSRDRVLLALNHQSVDRVPRDLWVSPEVANPQADEVEEMRFRYASDITRPTFQYARGQRGQGCRREVGDYTDAWGCTWRIPRRGIVGELVQPALVDGAAAQHYRPPLEILEQADLCDVNRGCAATSQFVLFWSETCPFERLQALRGPERAFADLAHGTSQVRHLLGMIHDFNCREMQLWASSDVDGVVFMDDWGSQSGLLVSPDMWRDWFKPLYGEYCDILHAADKYVFFHSDGNISDIFGDLVQLGVDAINAQLFSMDLEGLAADYRGQVTFWGEIDRLRILPQGTPDEVRAAVCRVQRALDFGRGGLIAQCEWGPDAPFQNVAAVFEQWLRPLPMHAYKTS